MSFFGLREQYFHKDCNCSYCGWKKENYIRELPKYKLENKKSLEDKITDLVGELTAAFVHDVASIDPRAWRKLLMYAPKDLMEDQIKKLSK